MFFRSIYQHIIVKNPFYLYFFEVSDFFCFYSIKSYEELSITQGLFSENFSANHKLRFLIKTDPELWLISNIPQAFVELISIVTSCNQVAEFEKTFKTSKKQPKNGHFYHIFQFFFILGAWLQYLTLVYNCIQFLRNFETLHRSGSILIVKWESIWVKVPGCKYELNWFWYGFKKDHIFIFDKKPYLQQHTSSNS